MPQAETDEHRLSIRVTTDLKDRFEAACAKKKISQQAAVVSLMDWWARAPELLQSLVVGHINGREERQAVAAAALKIFISVGPDFDLAKFDQVLDEIGVKGRGTKPRSR